MAAVCFLPEMQTRPRQGERSGGGTLSEGLWADHRVLAWSFPLLPFVLTPKGSKGPLIPSLVGIRTKGLEESY